MKSVAPRERTAWIVVSAILLAGLVFFAFSPRILAGSTEEETQAYLSTFADVFRRVRDTYVDGEKATPRALYEGAMKGMFEALEDPYSVFYNASGWTDLADVSKGTFGGVGLEIQKADKVGARVVAAIEGTPAYRAGITAGDLIVAVNGESIAELTLDQIRDKLRGEPKTKVTVSVRRGDTIAFDATITRDIITLVTVKSGLMPGNWGYIRVSEFTPQVATSMREAIRGFGASGYRGLVLDLRGDPGGLLSAAVDVTNLFLDGGPIVERKSERVPEENVKYTARATRMAVAPSIPVVVLVDRYSASASEIVAGALKDRGRAMLIGETTFGKGSVQTVVPVADGGYRLTTSRYYTPAGAAGNISIDKVGIVPDREVKPPELTEAEQKAVNDIVNSTVLSAFVKAHPSPTSADWAGLAASLRAMGAPVSDRLMRQLVRGEQLRTVNNPPPFDLEFDVVLQAAVKALESGEVVPRMTTP